MAILARLGVNIAANIGFQYAAEILPTVVRAQGVSLIHIIGYIAHIIGPYVIYLVKYPGKSRRFYDYMINEIEMPSWLIEPMIIVFRPTSINIYLW